MTNMIGKVSCDLHDRASRVRVQIDGTDGIPLSVKASLNNYPRSLFKKGVAVEVKHYGDDGRQFLVTQVFEPVRKSVHLKFDIEVRDADEFKRNQNMQYVSKDCVRFFIGPRYFDRRLPLANVLAKAFYLSLKETNELIDGGDGFWVTCRQAQFARFMIYRNEAGITNGFMDLQAGLIDSPAETDYYAELSERFDIPRQSVKLVVQALGYDHDWVAVQLSKRPTCREVDVSDNR